MPASQPLRRFKAEFFKALAHPTRIHILETLRDGERTVSELQVALGIDGSGVSQQLGVLRARNIVESRKTGTSVYYRVRDREVFRLLDVARQIFNNQLIDLQASLEAQLREDELLAASSRARDGDGEAAL
jgi:DNA-binding transcriptional ArsR family regulator